MNNTKDSIKKPKPLHKDHRQRMKSTFLKAGFDAFSDIEKLEFILFFAISQKDTNPLAHRLLDEFGSFDKVLEANISELKSVEGIGEHAAILLNLLLQITSVYGKSKCEDKITGTNSAKIFANNLFKGTFVEEFFVICLDTSNRVIFVKNIKKGTRSEVSVDIRELTKVALDNHCERIIVAHNHPMGLCLPSDEDISFTSKIVFSCIINNIELIDHIIISKDDQFSFEEALLLPTIKSNALKKIPCDIKTKEKFGQRSNNYTIDSIKKIDI